MRQVHGSGLDAPQALCMAGTCKGRSVCACVRTASSDVATILCGTRRSRGPCLLAVCFLSILQLYKPRLLQKEWRISFWCTQVSMLELEEEAEV